MATRKKKPGVEGLKAIADLAKQLITLGSALIGVTVTFAEKFNKNTSADAALTAPPELALAWIAYLASVVFAVWTLMAVAGSLDEIDRAGAEMNPNRDNTKFPGAFMLLTFFAGLVLTTLAGWNAVD